PGLERHDSDGMVGDDKRYREAAARLPLALRAANAHEPQLRRSGLPCLRDRAEANACRIPVEPLCAAAGHKPQQLAARVDEDTALADRSRDITLRGLDEMASDYVRCGNRIESAGQSGGDRIELLKQAVGLVVLSALVVTQAKAADPGGKQADDQRDH